MSVEQLKPGPELDRLVAEKMGVIGDWVDELLCANYSTDIAAAWEVFNWIMDNKVKRRRFLRLLQEKAVLDDGSLPDWPDVLVVLRKRLPAAICLAFLALGDSPDRAQSPTRPETEYGR